MKQIINICIFCAALTLFPAVSVAAQEILEGNATWYRNSVPDMIASHARLPIGTQVRITNLENGNVVNVSISDRIPTNPNRILDISEEAALALGMNPTGYTRVRYEVATVYVLEPAPPVAGDPFLSFDDDYNDYDANDLWAEPPMEIFARSNTHDEVVSQPPSRTVIPEDDDWDDPRWVSSHDDPLPPSPPPPPVSVQVVHMSPQTQPVSIRLIVNIGGQEHIIDIPDVAALSSATPPPPPPPPPPLLHPPPPPPPPPPPVAPAARQAVHVPASRPPATVSPQLPDPASGRIFRVQVGSFSRPAFAQEAFDRLVAAGFSPAFERHGNMHRVVISGVRAVDVAHVAQRLGNAGFTEAWLRAEN